MAPVRFCPDPAPARHLQPPPGEGWAEEPGGIKLNTGTSSLRELKAFLMLERGWGQLD